MDRDKLEAGIVAGFIAGSSSFYAYSQFHFLLGIILGALIGFATFTIVATGKMNFIRRVLIVVFSILVWVGFGTIIGRYGSSFFQFWAAVHPKAAVEPSPVIISRGLTYLPCVLSINQILLGIAPAQPLGFDAIFPVTMAVFLMGLGLYAFLALLFGRGWCGWMCFIGGIAEASLSGRKERVVLRRFRETFTLKDGTVILAGLKEKVKDVKYGILLAAVVLSFTLAWNVFCVFCWAPWFASQLGLSLAIIIILVFFVILPFLTKHRAGCNLVCPVGAGFGLIGRISLFAVKIDKTKCNECYQCVQVCPMYAITPKTIAKTGQPNLDCIKCGKCIDACPQKAIDIYFRKSSVTAQSFFVPLAIALTPLMFMWFILAIGYLTPSLLGL